MSRVMMAGVTGVVAAIAGYWLAMVLLDALMPRTGGSDQSIARAMLALVAAAAVGLAAGVGGFVAVMRVVPEDGLRTLLLVDGVLAVGMGALFVRTVLPPPRLVYERARPSLEVELRVPKTYFAPERFSAVVITLAGTDAELTSRLQQEKQRDEGDAVVMVWETTPNRIRTWEVSVYTEQGDTWHRFPLALPKRPEQSTPWSAWQTTRTAPDLRLRWRFRLHPHGQPETD